MGYQAGRGFGLQDELKKIAPRLELPPGWAYACDDSPAIDWGKLTYFALSVFWRGACDSWTSDAVAKRFIEMDPVQQEQLRLFLLCDADYPAEIMLMLRVASSRRGPAHLISFPSEGTLALPTGSVPQFSFMIPGMIFTLVPASATPQEYMRQGCLIRGDGHPLLLLRSDQMLLQEQLKLLLTAEPSKRIVEEVRAALATKHVRRPSRG